MIMISSLLDMTPIRPPEGLELTIPDVDGCAYVDIRTRPSSVCYTGCFLVIGSLCALAYHNPTDYNLATLPLSLTGPNLSNLFSVWLAKAGFSKLGPEPPPPQVHVLFFAHLLSKELMWLVSLCERILIPVFTLSCWPAPYWAGSDTFSSWFPFLHGSITEGGHVTWQCEKGDIQQS